MEQKSTGFEIFFCKFVHIRTNLLSKYIFLLCNKYEYIVKPLNIFESSLDV